MKISKRTEVAPKEIWRMETEFSAWLASEAGLELIASDIGIEVENTRTESSPGDFRCDIVGNALDDENHRIVIENQYGKTDHDHLGKMLTYAAVHDATTGIWISERVSDDHRQVIDWLNEITPANVNFYLAQIKAYRIDDSAVAPQLEVVCRPNLDVKLQRDKDKQVLSNSKIWNKEFWEDVLPYIKTQNPPFNLQNPGVESWSSIAMGRTDIWLELVTESRNPCIRCEICIKTSWRAAAFEQLFAQKSEIENEIGCELEWLLLPDKKITRIRVRKEIDPKDEANRDAIKQWMHKYAVAFHNAFRLRIAHLDADYEIESSGEMDVIEAEDGLQVLAA